MHCGCLCIASLSALSLLALVCLNPINLPKPNSSVGHTFLQLTRDLGRSEPNCRLYFEFGGRIRFQEPVGLDGQKAVCLDAGLAPSIDGNCLVYSFGTGSDWSFERTMESYGCDVFSFDPSIGSDPPDRPAHLHFYPLALGPRNLGSDRRRRKVLTLDTIRRYFGHQRRIIDYLKIDVEGDEWQGLQHLIDANQLERVKQISAQLHLDDVRKFAEYRQVICDLEASGFRRFFARENPWKRNAHLATLGRPESAGYQLAWFNSNFSIGR